MPPPRSRLFPFGLPGYQPPRSRFFPGCGHPRAVRADGRYGHHEQYGPTGTRGTTGTTGSTGTTSCTGRREPETPRAQKGIYLCQPTRSRAQNGTYLCPATPKNTSRAHTTHKTCPPSSRWAQIRYQMCQNRYYFFDLRALFIERLNSRSSNVIMPLSCTSILDLPLTFSLITSSPTNE